ncbi:hypothetical protein D9M71_776690 [compost metagenome]
MGAQRWHGQLGADGDEWADRNIVPGFLILEDHFLHWCTVETTFGFWPTDSGVAFACFFRLPGFGLGNEGVHIGMVARAHEALGVAIEPGADLSAEFGFGRRIVEIHGGLLSESAIV